MHAKKIPLSYNQFDTGALNDELLHREGSTHNEILEAFEAALCECTKSPYAVAVSSGTAALHLALKVAGVQKGDYVPVSTFTYIGSANPVCYLDARPVFIDSERDTWNMDPNLLEDFLKKLPGSGPKAKAIEVVHTYGMPAKMNEIMAVASRFGVPVIEDAAAGIGGRYQNNSLGAIADIGIFSFNNNKTITTFGGGAVLTKSKKIYDRVKFLATQARENKPFYEFNEVGYNYRMGSLNAVYGLSQLKKINEKITERRSVYDKYSNALKNSHDIVFQPEPPGSYSSRWLTALHIAADGNISKANEKIHDELAKQGIESRYLWRPMHLQPVFKGTQHVGGAVSEMLFNTGLCLPSGSGLSDEAINTVTKIIIDQVPHTSKA